MEPFQIMKFECDFFPPFTLACLATAQYQMWHPSRWTRGDTADLEKRPLGSPLQSRARALCS